MIFSGLNAASNSQNGLTCNDPVVLISWSGLFREPTVTLNVYAPDNTSELRGGWNRRTAEASSPGNNLNSVESNS